MSKAVLISIQPQWCELIVSGKKTLEVRKNRPELETPFKCYIYCTYGKGLIERSDPFLPNMLIEQKVTKEKTWGNCCNGKVIGEFVCDKIVPIKVFPNGTIQNYMFYDLEQTKVPYDDIAKYIGDGRDGCGWHISNLMIYDRPKELSEFEKPCKCIGEYEGEAYCDCLNCDDAGDSDYGVIACDRKLKRPPQSWCYVEELKGGTK